MKKGFKEKNKFKLTTLGFTLIELLATIIILGIIASITYVIVNNVVLKSKDESLKRTIETIEKAALNYSTVNDLGYSQEKKGISLETLVEAGFLEGPLIDPVTNYELKGCVVFYWDDSTNQYVFEYDQVCENYSDVKPSLVMSYRESLINENGWAKENVAVTLTSNGKITYCLDNSECTPNTELQQNTNTKFITQEGTNYLCAIASNNLGSTEKQCVNINLDKTAPTAGTATFTGTLGSNSWYTTDVTVNVKNGSDSLSGHSSTVSNVTSITSNTTGTTVRITTTDLAGNTASRDYTIKLDKNSPTISAKSSSVEVYYGDSNVVSNYFNTSYSTSGGSVSCSPTNTNEYSLAEAYETFTATCTATGGNGKTASSSISIRVITNNLYGIFIKDAVPDNTSSTYVSSSTGINFSSAASSTNGLGYYYSSTNGIYYARGSVTNNNVLFANSCWKMVITTTNGGVKLVYNGVSSNGTCNNTGTSSQIGTSAFNSVGSDNAYVGYMYGAPETSTIYGDMNGDGNVTASDYLLLKRFIICSGYLEGDMNGDGELTASDYLLLSRIVNGTSTPTEEEEFLGDVDGDGELTEDDVTLLKQYVLNGAPTIDCSTSPTEEQKLLGDVNLDGSLTPSDYVIVKNYVLKSIDSIIDQNTDTARYNATHKNKNNSTIKSTIDSWYASNMTSYTSKLEDAIWCNDRSLSSSTYKGYGSKDTNYGGSRPSVTCTNANDRFTVSTSNGNGALTYPVGLLTYDEWILAGRTVGYLNSGSTWWTMTPVSYEGAGTGAYVKQSLGYDGGVTTSYGVRPSIVLKSGTMRISGTGTASDPFVVS